MKPLISVIIPTYERSVLLQRALQSAINQTYPNLEIIVIGDGDPTLEATKKLCPFEGIKWINTKKNYGPGGAIPRNFGIMASTGEYISYLDSDNMWKPNHVQSLYEAISKTPMATWAMSSMEVEGVDFGFTECKHGQIDTSCLMHHRNLIAEYGLWKPRADANNPPFDAVYWHDFEIAQRWYLGGEPYVATCLATVDYNAKDSGQYEYLMKVRDEILAKQNHCSHEKCNG